MRELGWGRGWGRLEVAPSCVGVGGGDGQGKCSLMLSNVHLQVDTTYIWL